MCVCVRVLNYNFNILDAGMLLMIGFLAVDAKIVPTLICVLQILSLAERLRGKSYVLLLLKSDEVYF